MFNMSICETWKNICRIDMDVWWCYMLVVFILDVDWDFGRRNVGLTCLLVFSLLMVFNFQFVDILGGCKFQCGIVVMFFKLIVVDELWSEVLVILFKDIGCQRLLYVLIVYLLFEVVGCWLALFWTCDYYGKCMLQWWGILKCKLLVVFSGWWVILKCRLLWFFILK
jgi:hypothetical protein